MEQSKNVVMVGRRQGKSWARGIFRAAAIAAAALTLTACNDADVVNSNLSKAADNFQVMRRVSFYNSITGEYLLTIEGLCSMDLQSSQALKVTCKTGPDEYKRHYLGLSGNLSYFAEQMDGLKTDPYHYKVVFKPAQILPTLSVE